MTKLEKILVIKINVLPQSAEALKERTRKAWKISPKRLDEVKHVIVLYRQKVLEEYNLGSPLIYHLGGEEKGRVELQLEDYVEEKTLKGKTLQYQTSNPATIKAYKDLMELIMD